MATSAAAPSSSPIAPRRRNGRPQACEPCRKRKTACDHSLPTCQRCRKRGTEKDCVFLPAPMTRRSAVSSQTTPIQRPPITPSATTPSSAAGSPGTQSICFQSQSIGRPAKFFGESSGFLGPTSFSATLQDTSESLGPLSAPNNLHEGVQAHDISDVGRDGGPPTLDASLVKLGMQILEQIPNEQTSQTLDERYSYPDDGISRLARTWFSKDLWELISGCHESQEHRRSLVEKITTNTSRSLQDEDDPTKWIDSFTGQNLRWEVLGILFACWASSAASLSPEDRLLEAQFPSKDHLAHFKECALSCAKLCYAVDCSNSLYVYLLCKCNTLESIIGGETSKLAISFCLSSFFSFILPRSFDHHGGYLPLR